jgi:hypothetical protein
MGIPYYVLKSVRFRHVTEGAEEVDKSAQDKGCQNSHASNQYSSINSRTTIFILWIFFLNE